MPIITLTTDFGTRDYYAAVVKGEILSAIADAQIIDISHDIEPFDIMHGAYVLKNAYPHFPAGSIHIIGVNLNSETGLNHLVAAKDGHTFIGPDNGIFGLLWEGEPAAEAYQLQPTAAEYASTLPVKDLYVRVAKHICEGGKLTDIGKKSSALRQSMIGRPMSSANYIRASIIYFDRFENAIVNIRKDEFDRIGNNRPFVIFFKRYDDIEAISENYFDVPESEKLCLFNSGGYLEIAINKGNARGLLNLNIGDIVQVDFK